MRRSRGAMTMRSLVRNWWMIAVRGGLAIAFGVAVLMWPDVTLSTIVVLFGAYAVLDGAWAIVAAVRAAVVVWEAWPVLFEGVASLVLGVLATGVLEPMAAADAPRSRPAHWLLATGGASSLFLALLVMLLPFADAEIVGGDHAADAQIFGMALLPAALDFPRRHATDPARSRSASSCWRAIA